MADPFYLIECKDEGGKPFFFETDGNDCTHAGTLKRLREGQTCGFEIARILEIDLSEGTARDVSDDFASHIHGWSHTEREEAADEVAAFCERLGFDTHKDPDPDELWDEPEHYYRSGRADHERAAYRGYA